MVDDFNETLRSFSERHGAFLLEMHHELKAIQVGIDGMVK